MQQFEYRLCLLPYFCPYKHSPAFRINPALGVWGAPLDHWASRSALNNSGLKGNIYLPRKVTSYTLGLSFYLVPMSVKWLWNSLLGNTTAVNKMCYYSTSGSACQNITSTESNCTALPTAASTSLSHFRQHYIIKKILFRGETKIKTLPMVLISLLFYLWLKAVSGRHQKHPFPRVFSLQFHLIMEVYFHPARMGKD